MATATLPAPPRKTANPAPARPSSSVRRTSSIDVSWPDGEDGSRLFVGRVRDYLTPSAGAPGKVLDEAEFRARITEDKTITSITVTPPVPGVEKLVGMRGGNHLRLFIKETMPHLIDQGAPIYLALDDISGTALVSASAWSRWADEDMLERMRKRFSAEELDRMMAQRVDVCWGLQAGNSGVQPGRGDHGEIGGTEAGDVRNPLDPEGWHELHEAEGAGFRRARRIDVTRDGDLIRVSAAFQDSVKLKDGGRGAIHEYDLHVTADAGTLEILTLDPVAHILPFSECPGAIHNAKRLIGSRITDVRQSVLAQLRGPEGCTHLNDALRALAEVPKLAGYLETAGV
jgi:hypothetical protein